MGIAPFSVCAVPWGNKATPQSSFFLLFSSLTGQ